MHKYVHMYAIHWKTSLLHPLLCSSDVCPQSLKAIVTPECLLVLDFRGSGLEKWLVLELAPQLAGDGTLVTYSLPFEFRALEALLQHRVNLQSSQIIFRQYL